MSQFNYQEFLDGLDRNAYHEGEITWEEDGFSVTRTYNYTAPGCHDSCGLLLYVDKEGKLDHVEGDPLDPVANGKLCMRCIDLPEMVNNDLRIKYPMIRDGERGENKWKRISWDESLDIIEKYIKEEIDDKGLGRESIVVGHGTGRNINWQVPFIAGACFGTPNVGGIYFSGVSCYAPRCCGSTAVMGDMVITDASETHEDRYNNPEWQAPSLIVIWGNEPFKSNADGYLGHWLNICVQMGAKIICIDPVLTWWGARAEYWLSINSGTDICLALAWAHVITQEDLIDEEFVSCWCAYYDEFKSHVAQFTPEWAAERCGLEVEDIIASARYYAAAERAMIQWGLPFDASTSSSIHLCSITASLMAICGNVDRPGTNILVHNAYEMNAGYSSVDLYCGEDAYSKKFCKSMVGFDGMDFMGMSNPDAMAKVLETRDPYPIKMFWIQSANQIAGHEEPAPRAYKYLLQVPFIVYVDPFMTPSCVAFADMVLPVAMSCERDSARTWWSPLRAMKKACSYYEAKSDEEIAIWLGRRLNPELFERWGTPIDLIDDYMLTDLAVVDEDGKIHKAVGGTALSVASEKTIDMNLTSGQMETLCPFGGFEDLVNHGGYSFDQWNDTYCKYEKGMLRPDGQPGFNTPSGRVELISSILQSWGLDPYPRYTPVSVGRDTTPELLEKYPFYFINGARSYEFFHTEHRQAETMREFHPEPLVKISPETAEEYGIEEGDWIWLENQDGRCMQKAHIFPGMDKRFVSAEHGWWKPEEDLSKPHFAGAFDYNPNNLTHAYESGPGNCGAPIKCLLCKIYKVEEGDVMPGTQVAELGGFRDYEPCKM